MAKAAKDTQKKKGTNNISKTDLPDVKTNAQTKNTGRSMKTKLGGAE